MRKPHLENKLLQYEITISQSFSGLIPLRSQPQCRQLSWIIQETPDFGPDRITWSPDWSLKSPG